MRHRESVDVLKVVELRNLGYTWREITDIVVRQDGSKYQPESIERAVRSSGLSYRKGIFPGRPGRKSGGYLDDGG